MNLYLYAIVPETYGQTVRDLSLEGIDQQLVDVEILAPFAVVYSRAQKKRYLSSRSNLLCHELVQEKIMTAIPNHLGVPLPLQFGLVVADWAEVHQALIVPYAAKLSSLLQELVGKREVSVKIFWDEKVELDLELQENQDLQQQKQAYGVKALSMDQAIEVGQIVANALEQRKTRIVNHFMALLSPMALKSIIGKPMTTNMTDMIGNISFLIENDREPEFAQQVEAIDALYDSRLRLRYNNFTAPYNFVKLSET